MLSWKNEFLKKFFRNKFKLNLLYWFRPKNGLMYFVRGRYATQFTISDAFPLVQYFHLTAAYLTAHVNWFTPFIHSCHFRGIFDSLTRSMSVCPISAKAARRNK